MHSTSTCTAHPYLHSTSALHSAHLILIVRCSIAPPRGLAEYGQVTESLITLRELREALLDFGSKYSGGRAHRKHEQPPPADSDAGGRTPEVATRQPSASMSDALVEQLAVVLDQRTEAEPQLRSEVKEVRKAIASAKRANALDRKQLADVKLDEAALEVARLD